MRMLELFAGTSHISKAFYNAGYEVVSVDLDEKFKNCVHTDAYQYIQEHGQEFDVIWASPDELFVLSKESLRIKDNLVKACGDDCDILLVLDESHGIRTTSDRVCEFALLRDKGSGTPIFAQRNDGVITVCGYSPDETKKIVDVLAQFYECDMKNGGSTA